MAMMTIPLGSKYTDASYLSNLTALLCLKAAQMAMYQDMAISVADNDDRTEYFTACTCAGIIT